MAYAYAKASVENQYTDANGDTYGDFWIRFYLDSACTSAASAITRDLPFFSKPICYDIVRKSWDSGNTPFVASSHMYITHDGMMNSYKGDINVGTFLYKKVSEGECYIQTPSLISVPTSTGQTTMYIPVASTVPDIAERCPTTNTIVVQDVTAQLQSSVLFTLSEAMACTAVVHLRLWFNDSHDPEDTNSYIDEDVDLYLASSSDWHYIDLPNSLVTVYDIEILGYDYDGPSNNQTLDISYGGKVD